jgi:hypothetical protein
MYEVIFPLWSGFLGARYATTLAWQKFSFSKDFFISMIYSNVYEQTLQKQNKINCLKLPESFNKNE